MKLRFLGTGTSFGIPVVGCDCATCTSRDPRDHRTRHGAMLHSDDGARSLLIDAPPELRLQLVRERVHSVDAVWLTHAHADHVHGIDDLRIFSGRSSGALPVYAADETAEVLRRRFDYIFDPDYLPPAGISRPHLELRRFDPFTPVEVAGWTMTPIEVPHGDERVFGFRTGALGYITDAKRLDDDARAALAGVRVLVVNALWHGRPHPTHFNIEEAIEAAAAIGAERTFLTHLTHRVRHADLLATLPAGIEPAHDGLVVDVPDTSTESQP